MKTGIELIADERAAQVSREGWTTGHDDEHRDASLATVAACYALDTQEFRRASRTDEEDIALRGETPIYAKVKRTYRVPILWPRSWHPFWWKPKDRVRDLVRAGALIAAEIDRLQRAKASPQRGAPSK